MMKNYTIETDETSIRPLARYQTDLNVLEDGTVKWSASFEKNNPTAYYIGLQLKHLGEQIMRYYKEHEE